MTIDTASAAAIPGGWADITQEKFDKHFARLVAVYEKAEAVAERLQEIADKAQDEADNAERSQRDVSNRIDQLVAAVREHCPHLAIPER